MFSIADARVRPKDRPAKSPFLRIVTIQPLTLLYVTRSNENVVFMFVLQLLVSSVGAGGSPRPCGLVGVVNMNHDVHTKRVYEGHTVF